MSNLWTSNPSFCPLSDRSTRLANGELLAEELNKMGLSAIFVKTIESPTAYIHNFNIENPLHLLKLEQIKKILSLRYETSISYGSGQSDSETCADFSITVDKKTTPNISWESHKNAVVSLFDFLIGIDTNNEVITANLADLPHLLIAGETGSGKSVTLHTILGSLLSHSKLTHDNIGLVLVDTKRTELTRYENSGMLACRISHTYNEASSALSALCREMDERYRIMAEEGLSACPFGRLVLVIDELADLMMIGRKMIEPKIIRLAQMGRAANIHLILATQRPTVDVCTGHIKANIPSRIALQVVSARDSMNIIDRKGAESLRGKGDALLKLSYESKIRRLQCFNCEK